MTGTLINVAAILLGSTLGILLGSRLPDKLKQTVIAGLGLFVMGLGFSMFLVTKNSLIVLGSLLLGALLGEWWRIEDGLHAFGTWLEERVNRGRIGIFPSSSQERFIRGFLTASLVYLVGPLSILGSIQDGLNGDYRLLAVKSVLDGFASLAFASSLGIGVAFSALPTLIYQGAISLMAVQVQTVMTADMRTEMTATGGILLLAIAISGLLEIKKIRSANFLPALLIAPLAVWALTALGIRLNLP
jgi:uncharacterized membrane protein YqgA involved in biofilm formation